MRSPAGNMWDSRCPPVFGGRKEKTTVTTTLKIAGARYASVQQHDISRCEQGLAPILGAICPCNGKLFGARRGTGPDFFSALSESDPHSFRTLPSCEAQLKRH
jgi:hypothetical protein